jgi:hypothetical protein
LWRPRARLSSLKGRVRISKITGADVGATAGLEYASEAVLRAPGESTHDVEALRAENERLYKQALQALTASQAELVVLQDDNFRLRRNGAAQDHLIADLRRRLDSAEQRAEIAELRLVRIEAMASWVSLLDATMHLPGAPNLMNSSMA